MVTVVTLVTPGTVVSVSGDDGRWPLLMAQMQQEQHEDKMLRTSRGEPVTSSYRISGWGDVRAGEVCALGQ